MFQSSKGISIKSMEMKIESKGSTKDRVYNRCLNNVSSKIANLDKTKTKKNKTLVDTASDNTALAMTAFQTIDNLVAENERLKKRNKKLEN